MDVFDVFAAVEELNFSAYLEIDAISLGKVFLRKCT
jgi:hypothetical protein